MAFEKELENLGPRGMKSCIERVFYDSKCGVCEVHLTDDTDDADYGVVLYGAMLSLKCFTIGTSKGKKSIENSTVYGMEHENCGLSRR